MRKRRRQNPFFAFIGRVLPYLATLVVIFGVAKIGAETKNNPSVDNLNINAMAANNYNISADQLSELYVVASMASNFDLASIETVASNYIIVSAMKEISQTNVDWIEKPSYTNTNISRGVDTYVVNEGDTMKSIAQKYGLTTDQIRWSNGLKTVDVTVGQSLKIPVGVAGIVYTVKAGDTPESLATKYRSNAEGIITYNDLEGSHLTEGMQIVLPNGILPVNERPEYVVLTSYNYTYSGSYANRENLTVISRGAFAPIYTDARGVNGNPMVRGQCTWYAWYWRATTGADMGLRPMVGGGTLGHARFWAARAAGQGYAVNRTPEVGAVFQTTAGYYGHVGIVLAVNGDGSIFVREMNLDGRGVGTLTEGTIPASAVGSFNYIH